MGKQPRDKDGKFASTSGKGHTTTIRLSAVKTALKVESGRAALDKKLGGALSAGLKVKEAATSKGIGTVYRGKTGGYTTSRSKASATFKSKK